MKRPTQADVARMAGVSTATVSYVLNQQTSGRVPISEDTQQRVLDAVNELGYQPDSRARSLRSGGTDTIGLIIPDMHNPHYWEIVDGVEDAVHDAGYELLLSTTSLDPQRELQGLHALSRRRIDALIAILSFHELSGKVLSDLASRNYPVVAVGGATIDVDTVTMNFGEGMQQVMSHLVDLGHRRIGLVHGVGSPDLGVNRLESYRQTLLSAGLIPDESLIDHCGITIEEGYRAAMRLLKRPDRPSALVVINDLLGMGVLRAASTLELSVPDEISVASFDDIELSAYTNPPLTTVRANARHIGQEATRLALARIKDGSRPVERFAVQAHIVIRSSTGPVPTEILVQEEVPTQQILS